ncbi:MAG: prepilin-type N-terminal cleavage/methylation domain-containing protein, partial [Gammaproteobacteria bacterium]|nr:prepilin-type N-terminal cleavage/methylation domain-containing protein [Gammaproteobacteria bacterium]
SKKHRGFSLIELMVVVLIIGIAASMAVLTIDNSDDRLKSEAKRLFAMAQLARDDAIVTGEALAIKFETKNEVVHYSFLKPEDGKWAPFSRKPFKQIKLSKDISLRSIISGEQPSVSKLQNVVYFLPTGESSEFQIWISNKNTEYLLSSTLLGELTFKRSEE